MESIGYIMIKSGQKVLKGVNRLHNDKIGTNGLERSQLGTQCKIMSYCLERGQLDIIQKSGQMVLK